MEGVVPKMITIRVCSVSVPRNENKNKNNFDGIPRGTQKKNLLHGVVLFG